MGKGSGNELKSKFMSLSSSSAIAVNAFGFFCNSNTLIWPNVKGQFNSPLFEVQLENGLNGTNPNLDVLIENETTIVAIECKFLEPLKHTIPKFSKQYLNIKDSRNNSGWFKLLRAIYHGEKYYKEVYIPQLTKHLDVAQLIKHFMGLSFNPKVPKKELKLAYVYWEPGKKIKDDLKISSIYDEHKESCENLSKLVEDDRVSFEDYSYFELINFWRKKVGGSKLERYFNEFDDKYRI